MRLVLAVPLTALLQRRIVTMSNPYRLRHRLETALGLGAASADVVTKVVVARVSSPILDA